jgi:hypothetical protein
MGCACTKWDVRFAVWNDCITPNGICMHQMGCASCGLKW